MSHPIPTSEPSALRQGDTWKWRRDDLGDYPPATWSLTYHFRNAASFFDVTAVADAGGFLVSVPAATTANHAAGNYHWIAVVSDGTDRHQVDQGVAVVEFDMAAQLVHDARSLAEKMVDALESAMLGKATREQLELISAASQDSNATRDPAAMRSELNLWRLEVQRQRGQGGLKTIQARLP